MIKPGEFGDTLVQFGDGDVRISRSRYPENEFESELVLSNELSSHLVGTIHNDLAGQLTSVLDNPIRLQFGCVESLDVLVEELQRIRKQMVQALGEPKSGSQG